MKNTPLLFTLALAFFAISCVSPRDIKDLQAQIDAIRTEKIAPIENQISYINTSIATLQTADTRLKELIDDLSISLDEDLDLLRQKDSDLEDTIAALQEYVDSGIKDTRDWASATFLTLDYMDNVAMQIAQVKSLITALELRTNKKIAADIKSAISDFEASLKKWVNESLGGYLTIADAQARLDALKSDLAGADNELGRRIDDVEGEIAAIRDDMDSSYREAVKEAIAEYDGALPASIASALGEVNGRIDSAVADINGRLDSIESRLDAIEAELADLVGRIQSVTVIPQYSNGGVGAKNASPSEMCFEVFPTLSSKDVTDLGTKSFVLSAVYTTLTKAADSLVTLPITRIKADAGRLVLSVDCSLLDSDFFLENIGVSARLLINKGGATATSGYFPLVPEL